MVNKAEPWYGDDEDSDTDELKAREKKKSTKGQKKLKGNAYVDPQCT